MRLLRVILAILLISVICCSSFAQDTSEARAYFSLTSDRTYLPGDKIQISVYANNVKKLEFRVYRIKDPAKFFGGLAELHNFGGQAPPLPKQRRGWLEKFHAWKHRMWARIRDFVRAQYSPESRHEIRLWRIGETPKKAGPAVEGYAAVPVLNPQQVVATWRWKAVAPKEPWQSETVTIPVKDKGVYLVEATNGRLRAYTVVIVSEMAIVTKTASGRALNFVVDRQSGKPVAGALVRVWADQQEIASRRTDDRGLADVQVNGEKPDNLAIVVSQNDDFTVNAPGTWNMSTDPDSRLHGYTYTDRPVYRPGDTVHFKSIVRSTVASGYEIPRDRELSLSLRDPRTYQVVWQHTAKLSNLGTTHWDYDIPGDAHLGTYYLNIQMGERYLEGTSFSVEDYKKPDYEVKVTAQTPRVLQGKPIKATINARYYFGEPVANAKVTWVVHTSTYWPMGTDEDEVADDGGEGAAGGPPEDTYDGEQQSEQTGTLDADGNLDITVPTKVDPKKQDVTYRIEARVTDAGNREISGHGFALATYGSFFLTAAPGSYVYSKGSTATVNVTAQDYEIKPVPTAFHIVMSRWDWRTRTGTQVSTQSGQTDALGKAQVQLPIPDAGEFRVVFSATTPEGRTVETTTYLWAPGETSFWGGTQEERLQIVADKKSYQPGDTAHVLIVTGSEPASLLVTTEGRGLYSAQVVEGSGGSVTVDVPIKAEFAPNFYVSTVYIRGNKLYQGSKSLKVPPTQHELKVELKPSKPQYQPGEAATYTISAHDARGKPVQAEFSLGVVDEAIYAIRPESIGTILSAFYGTVYSQVSTETSLTYFFNGQAGKRQMQLTKLRPSTSLAQLKPERLVQPKVRKAFPDTAFWVADVDTDSSGTATVHFNYPDAITSWRATTRGVTRDTKVGSAVEDSIVRKNLMVRLVVPRFFRRGDEVTLSTIVQNYLPTAKTARVSMELQGLQVLEGQTSDISVPHNGTAKVDYRVRVLDVDSARVLGKALTDVESDAMELTLPVVPFGVQLSSAKSGSIAGAGGQDTVQTITFPADAEPGTRKLRVSITPSVAGSLFSALEYLTSYPYGCTEQIMSSFLPDVLVANAMQKLNLKTSIDPQVLQKQVNSGLDRLYKYQHPDGGWGWWQTDDSQEFMTAYVLAGLSQAKAAGFEVSESAIDGGRRWLRSQFDNSQHAKTDLRAFLAYALMLSGDHDAAVLESVWQQRSTLTSYGQALLGLAMADAGDSRASTLAKELEEEARQDDSQAWWPLDNNNLMDYYGDTTPQATAYGLKLINQVDPASELLPKAAVYLVTHRNQGFWWDSTEQTAMVIYGLTDYLHRTRALKASYSVEIQVNGKMVATKKFTPDDALAPAMSINLGDAQLSRGDNRVQVTKSGEGRLYWSTRGEYYSSNPKVVNTGTFQLSVARQYYKLNPENRDGRVVYRLEALTTPVVVGDTLAVRLTVGGGDWEYLMIEDPIPSGTESIPRDDLYQLDQQPTWWNRWLSNRELRDDRTDFFKFYFPRGQHEYVYLLKVVNPGIFRVSPTRVEPMYQPEYLSTSSAFTVTVK